MNFTKLLYNEKKYVELYLYTYTYIYLHTYYINYNLFFKSAGMPVLPLETHVEAVITS